MSFQLSSPVTFRSTLEQTADYLDRHDLWFGQGTDNSWDEAVALLLWSAALPADTDAAILDSFLETDVVERFMLAVNRRVDERIPAAYITQEAWFYGLPFHVNKDVLIPRSPIAELIGRRFQPWLKTEPRRICDLCCGCGCIGIAAAVEFPGAEVILADLSAAALNVANRNIQRHQCGDRVKVAQGDLFAPLNDQRFDLILCNPPYVDAGELASMPQEYHHEPAMGLGSGDDGLDLTRRILAEAADYLSDQGLLILEVGHSWQNLEAAYPTHSFLWLEFEHGGEGVCVLNRQELLQFQQEHSCV